MTEPINFQPVFDYIDQKNDDLLGKMKSEFVTKSDIFRIEKSIDYIMTMVERLDKERLVTIEWVKRIGAEVERIKKHLQIV